MSLIEQIIEELTDPSKTLAAPLLKLKVLASRVGNKELYNWVDNELSGYKSRSELLPEYRFGRPNFLCTIRQGYTVQENVPLPLMIFDKDFIIELTKFKFDDSVQTLESQASGESGDTIYKPFPPDMCSWLTSQIQGNHILNMEILELRLQIHISSITQVLSVIRSKMLHFILLLEEEFPNFEDSIKEKITSKEKMKEKVEKIFHKTIIKAGHGSTITTGSSNTVTTTNSITINNESFLRETLGNNNVSQEDINDIVQIVNLPDEAPERNGNSFGQKTNAWLMKMYQKSIDGSWEVGIATAGGMLVEVLKQYFGIN